MSEENVEIVRRAFDALRSGLSAETVEYRFRGAKVDRLDIFGTRMEALEAIG